MLVDSGLFSTGTVSEASEIAARKEIKSKKLKENDEAMDFLNTSAFLSRNTNQDIKHLLIQAKKAPQVSHTTASLIYLIREGFTGEVFDDSRNTIN